MPVPTHLQAYVRPGSLNSPDNIEYRFSLAADGADRFRIRYYGELYDGLITDTEDAPARIVAIEPESGREILLFDGGRHGYNAMLSATNTTKKRWKTAPCKIWTTPYTKLKSAPSTTLTTQPNAKIFAMKTAK